MCERLDVSHTPTLKLYHLGKEVMTYRADIYHIDLLRWVRCSSAVRQQSICCDPDMYACGQQRMHLHGTPTYYPYLPRACRQATYRPGTIEAGN